jgi:hypothetical protein
MPVYAGEAELIQSESEEFLYCGICRHKYDFHRSRPKLLPCAHTFCLTCLQVNISDRLLSIIDHIL